MISDSPPLRWPVWARLLCLVLVGAMLLQSGPVQVFEQHIRHTQTAQACSHCDDGVCPRRSEANCTCTHSEPAGPEGVVLRSCDQETSEALASIPAPKWQSSVPMHVLGPRLTGIEYAHLYSSLPPQRVGDEVFRPPRTTPSVRLI